ncbi:hypothetical protein AVEN_15919-1 [Araneus ventricosus]|uniref:Uncharacterized protein n=1 Tax=Araneus ventricosus TaxID=182803 RepID=A0A4Y2QKU2_ARAVE|nr:hypothetical protein AVEN_15919-1 [Araneus ventricosus]
MSPSDTWGKRKTCRRKISGLTLIWNFSIPRQSRVCRYERKKVHSDISGLTLGGLTMLHPYKVEIAASIISMIPRDWSSTSRAEAVQGFPWFSVNPMFQFTSDTMLYYEPGSGSRDHAVVRTTTTFIGHF